MVKITAVLPSEDFSKIFKEIFSKHTQNVYELMYDKDQYEMEVIVKNSEIEKINVETDVIICRGMTAYELRKVNYNIPVVEIPVSSNAITRCLWKMKQNNAKNVAAIGSTNMIMGAESMSDIFNMHIKSFISETHDEIKQNVERAIKEGFNNIIGGISTCELAIKLGCNAEMLNIGREAIWHAITEAKRIAYISRSEQEKAMLFKTILDHAYEGIIAVDNDKKISVFNCMSQKTLGVKRNTIGKDIIRVINERGFTQLFESEDKELDKIIKYKNKNLALNKVPIILKNEKVGDIVTFQDVTKIQQTENLIRKKIYARGHIAKYTFEDIIGQSDTIKHTITKSKRYSNVDSNILIVGKTGTGKELLAQSIHNYSKRSNGPFVAVNCAALPENLLQSELFGYVEGAFTGAAKGGKVGLFELAHKGTIFLDEISEISYELQGRLLRVIQEKEIMRIGHDKVIPIDVHIITASNKELKDLVESRKFREDLYYRLDVLKINMPSLNERKEDIPLIVEDMINKFKLKLGKYDLFITKEAKESLKEYDWPGNVRELINICERLCVLSINNVIDEKDVLDVLPEISKEQLENIPKDSVEIMYDEAVKKIEKEKILQALKRCGGNKKIAAEKLGVSRTTLWRKIKELGIE